MIADMDTTSQMVMVTNTQAKNTQINIHKVCHWAMINSNMIRLVKKNTMFNLRKIQYSFFLLYL